MDQVVESLFNFNLNLNLNLNHNLHFILNPNLDLIPLFQGGLR